MSDESLDVLIAVYLIPDLAKQDFDGLVELVEDKTVSSDGVVLVSKDAEGEVHVEETGDHLGRKGVKVGGGVGLVVGLFAPPLLAATVVGAAAGGLAGQVRQEASRLRDRREDGRGAAPRIGRRDRDLRPRPGRPRRRGARQRDQEVDGSDRQGEREGAQGRGSPRPAPGSEVEVSSDERGPRLRPRHRYVHRDRRRHGRSSRGGRLPRLRGGEAGGRRGGRASEGSREGDAAHPRRHRRDGDLGGGRHGGGRRRRPRTRRPRQQRRHRQAGAHRVPAAGRLPDAARGQPVRPRRHDPGVPAPDPARRRPDRERGLDRRPARASPERRLQRLEVRDQGRHRRAAARAAAVEHPRVPDRGRAREDRDLRQDVRRAGRARAEARRGAVTGCTKSRLPRCGRPPRRRRRMPIRPW